MTDTKTESMVEHLADAMQGAVSGYPRREACLAMARAALEAFNETIRLEWSKANHKYPDDSGAADEEFSCRVRELFDAALSHLKNCSRHGERALMPCRQRNTRNCFERIAKLGTTLK